jgi:hypothetical protein
MQGFMPCEVTPAVCHALPLVTPEAERHVSAIVDACRALAASVFLMSDVSEEDWCVTRPTVADPYWRVCVLVRDISAEFRLSCDVPRVETRRDASWVVNVYSAEPNGVTGDIDFEWKLASNLGVPWHCGDASRVAAEFFALVCARIAAESDRLERPDFEKTGLSANAAQFAQRYFSYWGPDAGPDAEMQGWRNARAALTLLGAGWAPAEVARLFGAPVE